MLLLLKFLQIALQCFLFFLKHPEHAQIVQCTGKMSACIRKKRYGNTGINQIRIIQTDKTETITQMAEDTVRMVTESVDAFVKSDLELCRNVIDRDDVVDDAFNEIKEKLADMIYGGNLDAKTGLDLLMTAKYFERIGDHAVNIAEWVEYSITGQHRNNEHQDYLNN